MLLVIMIFLVKGLFMLAELSGFQMLLLNWALPGIIGAILAYVPLMMIIKSLHKLLDDLIAANEDGKINTDEYNQIVADVKDLKSSAVSLLELFLKAKGASNVKTILMILICCVVLLVGVGGCLWADSNTKLSLNMSAAAIGEINKRCQAGDCNACKDGLDRAAKMTTNIATLANGGKVIPNE